MDLDREDPEGDLVSGASGGGATGQGRGFLGFCQNGLGMERWFEVVLTGGERGGEPRRRRRDAFGEGASYGWS